MIYEEPQPGNATRAWRILLMTAALILTVLGLIIQMGVGNGR